MKFLTVLTIMTFCNYSIASSDTLLRLKREKPILDCEISQDSVKIVRTVQGISIYKNTSYQIQDLSSIIKTAYESRNTTSQTPTEHTAFLMEGGKKILFNLDSSDPNSLKIIRLISTLCEVRNQ